MKFSVFTACMPEYDLRETVALLARYGYDGVEWRVRAVDPARKAEPPSFWGNNRSTVDQNTIVERAAEVRELTRGAGLAIPALASYLSLSDYDEAERTLQAAKTMGAPMVRLGPPRYDRTRPYGELLAEGRAHLAYMARRAAAYGIKVLIEIHLGTIVPSAGLAYRLLEGADPEYAGAIYDPGNMVYEGREEWRMGMELLGPYLAHVHCKNALWRPSKEDADGVLHWEAAAAPLKRGIVDWGQVIADLKAVGYDGYLSLEDFDTGATTEEKIRDDIAYLKSLGA